MQNLKTMFRSPRFLLGFVLVTTVIIYAILYPMINLNDPKDNRIANPDYKMVELLVNALSMNDTEAALREAKLLLESTHENVRNTVVEVYENLSRAPIDRALSGVKQIKGSNYPLRSEVDNLRSILENSEHLNSISLQTIREEAIAELDRLTEHTNSVRYWAEIVKTAEDIEQIEDLDILNEFSDIPIEEFSAGVDALVSAHEANQMQLAIVMERLNGDDANLADIKKILTSSIPQTLLVEKNQPPSGLHPLGTEMFSRDVLLEMAYGARVSLFVGVIAGCIATFIGLSIGLFAGYVGGMIDNILSTWTNLFLVIPSYVILILVSIALGQIRQAWVTGLVIGLTAWPWTAKAVRAQTTSLRNRDHVNMARISGYTTTRIIISEILPYIASYVVMAFILQVASGIMAEATLAILGLGDPTAISLGRMISWAQQYESIVNGRWWEFFPVAICIAMITYGLYMMNSGMDQVFNPKIRS